MRARESTVNDFRALVDSMTNHLVRDLRAAGEDAPLPRYMTFGHSFGTLLSISVGAAVARAVGRPPLRAVLSAGLPPASHAPVDEAASLSDEELLGKIAAVGGTPAELLSGGALTRHVLRLFREDYAIRSQFFRQTSFRVDFPITLIAAQDDVYAPPEQMWKWCEHSSVPARQVVIPGGHFAAIREPERIIEILTDDIFSRAGASDAPPTAHRGWEEGRSDEK